jgi:molybdopterin/thiamine biosynthesis adenylyltransferase
MKKHDRQSFLGPDSEEILSGQNIAIVGLGGGGSHISQQVAHIGIGNVSIFDFDCVDEEGTNLNRLVGGTEADVQNQTPKVDVAQRLISGIDSTINVYAFKSSWQENHEVLRACDVIFGCVDSLLQRRDLESAARRFLTPYIDIGMDVTEVGDSFSISGQVFLSMPGQPCMQCLGLLPEGVLAEEAGQYGAAGSRPQVIWSNGILASAAVGLLMQLVTPWQKNPVPSILLEYDGNLGTVIQSRKLAYLSEIKCGHYPVEEIGDPFLQ